MPDLLLPDLQIVGYRGLRRLRASQLGRVNLIVGKNNVGKSTFLEALRLFASRFSPLVVRDILLSRDEIVGNPALNATVNIPSPLTFESLFWRSDATSDRLMASSIYIGNDSSMLGVQLAYYGESLDDQGNRRFNVLPPGSGAVPEPARVGFLVTLNGQNIRFLPLNEDYWYTRGDLTVFQRGVPASLVGEIAAVDVPSGGIDDEQLAELYDAALLNGLDEDVLSAVRIIDPDIHRVLLVGVQPVEPGIVLGRQMPELRKRVALVRGIQDPRPVPLRTRGDGMNRLFGIALSLVNAQNGILLIDEIENGVHYSAQQSLWSLILILAARLNVQVFATSHSWDCVLAFQNATEANRSVEGLLVRLEKRDHEVISVPFDEHELEIATRREIEVR